MGDQPKPEVRVVSDVLEAAFRPDVGMLGTSLLHRGDELLVPPPLDDPATLAGSPLLAPWANRLERWGYEVAGVGVDLTGQPLRTDPNGLPIHGTLTHRPGWVVEQADPGALTATFRYDADDLLAAFPFPHTITLGLAVDGGELRSATTVTPTGDRPVPVSFGYHPYLRLPGVGRDELHVRLPARRHIELDAGGLPTGRDEDEEAEEAPLGERTFDDLYGLDADRSLSIAGRGRRITLTLHQGYPYAQVFAPAGSDFVCLEPMTAPVNALVTGGYTLVPPGGTFTARCSVHVADAGTL